MLMRIAETLNSVRDSTYSDAKGKSKTFRKLGHFPLCKTSKSRSCGKSRSGTAGFSDQMGSPIRHAGNASNQIVSALPDFTVDLQLLEELHYTVATPFGASAKSGKLW